ncbi:MAG: hypothetical protein RLZZ444_2295, partial [Pseudomonadota bacterium]
MSPKSFLSDPVFHAVRHKHDAPEKRGNPFCGTFPNHFSVEVDNVEAAARVERRVRRSWCALAHAVKELIFEVTFDGTKLSDKFPAASDAFDRQIGSEDATPLWEIYTVVEEMKSAQAGKTGPSTLDMRKQLRWSEDMAGFSEPRYGGMCTMLPGWQEISGVEDIITNGRDRRDAFWAHLREAAVIARYGRGGIGRRSLDLVEKERLSAPALVKRLFPLLKPDVMEKIFGWAPVVRSGAVAKALEQETDVGKRLSFIGRILAYLNPHPKFESPRYAFELLGTDGADQSPMLWPSTSYISAAHWIETVHQRAPEQAKALRRAIEKCGPQYLFAEAAAFIGCTCNTPALPLASVDGGCLFESSVERMRKESKDENFASIANKLAEIARVPVNPNKQELGVIGRPAPVYAVVRADGDRMGELISKNKELSHGLSDFTRMLRGSPQDGIGVIAENNGITMYASADEMIALCPIEDALSLAQAIRTSFERAVTPHSKGEKTSVSVAITLAHRQVPLSWVMQSGARLLESCSKETLRGNALAIEIMDTGGRRNQWGAVFGGPQDPISKLNELINLVVGGPATVIASNQFLHDFAECMDPFLLPGTEDSLARCVGVVDELARSGA